MAGSGVLAVLQDPEIREMVVTLVEEGEEEHTLLSELNSDCNITPSFTLSSQHTAVEKSSKYCNVGKIKMTLPIGKSHILNSRDIVPGASLLWLPYLPNQKPETH